MISRVKTRCLFCGKEAKAEFFTTVGVVFIHDKCAQDLERMVAAHDEKADEVEKQPASLEIGND